MREIENAMNNSHWFDILLLFAAAAAVVICLVLLIRRIKQKRSR
jgi:flagellar biogenesis protein FliO